MVSNDTLPRPLAGLKVLELGQLIAGPFAGKVFAEFGAEVVKIEPPPSGGNPGGDPLRQWRLLHNGTSLWWYVQARNKKSVTVDLRKEEGQEIVRRLARERIAKREVEEKVSPPSEPQIFVGDDMATKLPQLEGALRSRRTGNTI